MKPVDAELVSSIAAIVGHDRIRDTVRERKMYSFDIGTMPPLVKPFVGAGLAGAVVRPRSEDDVAEILKIANKRGVACVARGASSSGYGGVLPKKGALVIDMSGINRIVDIDESNLTATVQAGAIWEDIQYELQKCGLELRLYPSSSPSSTAAGWLAQGGSGFGSYEYGMFKENVVAARIVTPAGEVHVMEGAPLLDGVADAEGITGIITELTIRVRPLEESRVRMAAFADTDALQAALTILDEHKAPIWSLSFLNPTAVELKRKLPGRTCHEHEKEEADAVRRAEENLPIAYLLLASYPANRAEAVDAAFDAALTAGNGAELSQEHAQLEWRERFNTMRLKRIGPSMVPTEVVVPLSGLKQTLDDIDDKIHQSFVMEGMYVKGGNVVLLGYIPHDERTFAFNPAFALALIAIKIARSHGGSAYSTGLYFRSQAESVLGREKIAALRRCKEAFDPAGIMNPGKVLTRPGEGGRALDTLMGIATVLEPIIRPLSNAAKARPYDEHAFPKEKNGIPGEVAYHALACARCGYCVHTCEQYSGRGWESQSPRGKYYLMREIYNGREKWDSNAQSTVMSCTTCERCDSRCQLQLPVEESSMMLRGKIVEEQKAGTFPPFEMMAHALRGEGDIWAGKRENRDKWMPNDVKDKILPKGEVMYFAGCTASYVETDIAEATIRLIQDAGYNVTYLGTDESCCGIPMKMAGKWELFEEVYRKNVNAARQRGVKTVVTSCPACSMTWNQLYPKIAEKYGEPYEIQAKHYSELVADSIQAGKLQLTRNPLEGKRVTFHDSCHLGRAQGIYEPPRDMLKAIPGIDYDEMEHNRCNGICCGSVITLVSEIDTAPKLGKERLVEATDKNIDTVIAACPCCQVQLRDSANKNDMPVEIDDLARAVASAAGHDIPKSDAYTTYMWSHFDKFIRLMDPKAMAEFMVPLFPDMIEAMGGMGSMMKAMAGTSAGTSMMKAMMPTMFPKMAPGIMDKVMPRMIDLMSEYMGELPPDMNDLLPDLIPKTLHSLMPTYIPELVPYLMPLFIDYLHGKDPIKENAKHKAA